MYLLKMRNVLQEIDKHESHSETSVKFPIHKKTRKVKNKTHYLK